MFSNVMMNEKKNLENFISLYMKFSLQIALVTSGLIGENYLRLPCASEPISAHN